MSEKGIYHYIWEVYMNRENNIRITGAESTYLVKSEKGALLNEIRVKFDCGFDCGVRRKGIPI